MTTLNDFKDELISRDSTLIIGRISRNRNGDRHTMSVNVAYKDYAGEIKLINIAYYISELGLMRAGKDTTRHTVVFGGGGTSPVTGTVDIIARYLGVNYTDLIWCEL